MQALVGLAQSFDLRPAIRAAAALMPVPVGEAVLADVLSFVRDRLYVWLRDQGLPHDVVAAVLAEQAHDPYRAAAAARELAALTQAPGWTDVFTAYARCKRIVRALPETYALAPDTTRSRRHAGCTRRANQRVSEQRIGECRYAGRCVARSAGADQPLLHGCAGDGRRSRRAAGPAGARAAGRGAA